MTDRLELNWKLDGFVDEQRYYCSETPIDPQNLPIPKAILAGDVRSHLDVDISIGLTYHIRMSAVRNGIEKISDEIVLTTSASISYRYLRIHITETVSEIAFAAIQEVEIAAVAGGPDLTTPNTPVTASSLYSYDFGPQCVVDNNFTGQSTGYWLSGYFQNFPQWLSIDFGDPIDIAELRIWPQYAEGALPRSPKNFIVQGSNDGMIWENIKEFSNVLDWQVGLPKTFNLITGSYQ